MLLTQEGCVTNRAQGGLTHHDLEPAVRLHVDGGQLQGGVQPRLEGRVLLPEAVPEGEDSIGPEVEDKLLRLYGEWRGTVLCSACKARWGS